MSYEKIKYCSVCECVIMYIISFIALMRRRDGNEKESKETFSINDNDSNARIIICNAGNGEQ